MDSCAAPDEGAAAGGAPAATDVLDGALADETKLGVVSLVTGAGVATSLGTASAGAPAVPDSLGSTMTVYGPVAAFNSARNSAGPL